MTIKLPSLDETKTLSRLLQEVLPHGHLLKGAFAGIGDGHFPCPNYANTSMQNPLKEGYAQCVEVKNLLVYNVRGDFVHAALNYTDYSGLASCRGQLDSILDVCQM